MRALQWGRAPREARASGFGLALVLGALVLSSCRKEACEAEPPSIQIDIRLGDPGMRTNVRSLGVTVRADERGWRRTFDLESELEDGVTELGVAIEPAPAGPFQVEAVVEAFEGQGGQGTAVAGGSSRAEATPNGCNRVAVDLETNEGASDGSVDPIPEGDGPSGDTNGFEDASVDGGGLPPDSAIAVDGSAAPEDADLDAGSVDGPSVLIASPSAFSDEWVDQIGPVRFETTITRGDLGSLENLAVVCPAAWACGTLSPANGRDPRTLSVVVETGLLSNDRHNTILTIASTDPGVTPVSIALDLRVLAQVHVGSSPAACLHLDPNGASTTSCDYSGPSAIVDAAAAIGARTRIIVHGGSAGPAYYTGGFSLPAETRLGAAPGLDPEDVVILCGGLLGYMNEAIALRGDGAWIERVSIVSQGECRMAINTWATFDVPEYGTGFHLIERLIVSALRPERLGGNSIQEPFGISRDSVIRGSLFRGYWEGEIILSFADRTRIVGNTFAYYQGNSGMRAEGTNGLVVANNVFLHLSRVAKDLIVANEMSTGLVVTGNAIEGYRLTIAGVDPTDTTIQIADNILGAVDLESPLVPLFLQDSSQSTGSVTPGEGTSLDGAWIAGGTNLLPGAYQTRSSRTLPRRMVTRVGASGCGVFACDISAADDNEIQRAVWSTWPGGAVEIYPSQTPYAGNAVVSWKTDIVGQGADPSDVVLLSREEDQVLASHLLWSAHRSLVVMLFTTNDRLRLENLTLRVDSGAVADRSAVMIESRMTSPPAERHILRRLRVESFGEAEGLEEAFLLGHDVLVQDTLVQGSFETCARFGPRGDETVATPPTTGYLVNVTCRLSGSPAHLPRAAFEVAGASNSRFVNLAVDLVAPAPLFRAQRRASGDVGEIALDPPIALRADALYSRNVSATFEGFVEASGSYTLAQQIPLLDGAPFFVSAGDSRLASGAEALDACLDPSTVESSLSAGTSLNGVSRSGRSVDCGAYEQGN